MQKKELLAPAGDIEAGYAALHYGADAVYLGLQQFSARATAVNFDETALDHFTAYAHSLGRKVYVTINTLIQECELADLLKSLDMCSNYHVDGIIVQDLGVAGIIKEKYPELELHASTQMAVHNKEGALALQKFGFKRVVLARELSLREIQEISALPGLETEAFIHGALCYSYSGLCLFSALEYGKSANRGQCLYPCRSEFAGDDGKGHYFSMKDMALQGDILKMPVTSLKIEGRKKNALYVAAVTDYYRHILDGRGWDEKKEENIRQIFSRPWCKFHFNGKDKNITDRDFVGHRGLPIGQVQQYTGKSIILKTAHEIARHDGIQIDVPGKEKPFGFSLLKLKVKGKDAFEAAAGENVEITLPPKHPALDFGAAVYLSSSSKVKGSYDYAKPRLQEFKAREGLDVVVDIRPKEVLARAKGVSYSVSGDFAPAQDVSKTCEAVEKSFSKTGETPFELGRLEVNNPGGLFVPASLLNNLRRGLYAAVSRDKKQAELPVSLPVAHKPRKPLIKVDKAEYLSLLNLDDFEEILFLMDLETSLADLSAIPFEKLRIALPAVCRDTEKWRRRIIEFAAAGITKWEIANYWGLEALPEGCDISFDAPLYMFNSQAVLQAKNMGAKRVCLPIEASRQNLSAVAEKSCLPVVFCIYQDVPLFTSAVCIRNNPCASCDRKEKWINLRKDGKFYQALSKNCQTMLFEKEALVREPDINADFYRLDFCYKKYKPEEVLEIVRRFF